MFENLGGCFTLPKSGNRAGAQGRINSRKMFVEELHDGKSVCNRVCELWLSRDSISCINMDVGQRASGSASLDVAGGWPGSAAALR